MTERDEKLELKAESITVEGTETPTHVTDEYDSPWKEAIEHFFPDFMAFYFPDACAQIDWPKEYAFLDNELRAVVQDAELGKRFVDKLVRVTLCTGGEKWVYIHIEVQVSQQAEFAERIFVYNYRLFDRYHRPIASMAVLADVHVNWKPDYFSYNVLGCETSIHFPIAKLTDYHDQLEALQVSDNPFAIVTAAHIQTQRTRKDDTARYQAKRLLVRLLYERQWERQKVVDLFRVIDWMMRLPEELAQELWQEINDIEESTKMQYVTSVERFEIAKVRQEGLLEGVTQGVIQGVIQGESKLLRKQLARRFGDLPNWVSDKLSSAGEQDLEHWGEAVLTAPTLDAVFGNDTTH
ncbi:MAG: cytosolic protein [Methylobacter sp.]|nr:cytosolic protein [Methylobacter sp.]